MLDMFRKSMLHKILIKKLCCIKYSSRSNIHDIGIFQVMYNT
jgi:hypothetical protein